MLYNNLSTYLRGKYGCRLSKICIDGGFTCPNRDGSCGIGGCIFCGERGSGEHIDPIMSIKEQAESALARGGRTGGFIAYFQNFTNTYAPVDVLRERYDSALVSDRIRVLAIGTRPDCITEQIAGLISEYKSRLDVWVELGLQTASDITAAVINRGYTTEVYRRACEILHRFDIPFVTHMMIGLPGEGREDVYRTVNEINTARSWGVKIHSLYVMEGTRLAEAYRRKNYTPPTLADYTSACAEAIARISSDTVIHRITGDCPRDMLVAPDWNRDKNAMIAEICRYMEEHGLSQGSLCPPSR